MGKKRKIMSCILVEIKKIVNIIGSSWMDKYEMLL